MTRNYKAAPMTYNLKYNLWWFMVVGVIGVVGVELTY